MNNFIDVTSNTPIKIEKENLSLWKQGKKDMKKFIKLKFGFKTNFITLVMGTLFALVLLLPLILLSIQLFTVFEYEILTISLFFITIICEIMLLNALANIITIEMTKSMKPYMTDLREINSKAIFIYQLFNPLLLLVIIFVAFIFFMRILI